MDTLYNFENFQKYIKNISETSCRDWNKILNDLLDLVPFKEGIEILKQGQINEDFYAKENVLDIVLYSHNHKNVIVNSYNYYFYTIDKNYRKQYLDILHLYFSDKIKEEYFYEIFKIIDQHKMVFILYCFYGKYIENPIKKNFFAANQYE